MKYTIKPKSRKEIYLAYLGGQRDLELPEPLTRDEINLYNICMNPSGGGGEFVVTFTDDGEGNWTADKSLDELVSAYNAGVKVHAKHTAVDGSVASYREYTLTDYVEDGGWRGFYFGWFMSMSADVEMRTIEYSDDGIELHESAWYIGG